MGKLVFVHYKDGKEIVLDVSDEMAGAIAQAMKRGDAVITVTDSQNRAVYIDMRDCLALQIKDEHVRGPFQARFYE